MAFTAAPSTGTHPEPEHFHVDVAPERESVVVAPHGELDLATSGELEATIRQLHDSGFGDVVVDLRELTFIDSTGLRLLLELNSEARADGTRLRLVEGCPRWGDSST